MKNLMERPDTDEQIKIFYFQVTDIWRRFCEFHSELFDLTCEEYSLLLGSDLDLLEEKLQEKNEVISKIKVLEELRQETINKINHDLELKGSIQEIQNAADLIKLMHLFEENEKMAHLSKFNELLIDLIEKIQAQNKKNQIFINKALLSLQEIKEVASGKNKFSGYTSSGETTKTTSK